MELSGNYFLAAEGETWEGGFGAASGELGLSSFLGGGGWGGSNRDARLVDWTKGTNSPAFSPFVSSVFDVKMLPPNKELGAALGANRLPLNRLGVVGNREAGATWSSLLSESPSGPTKPGSSQKAAADCTGLDTKKDTGAVAGLE